MHILLKPPRMVPVLSENAEATSFINRCEQWLCDDYSLDIHYIATESEGELRLFDALILLSPIPAPVDNRHVHPPDQATAAVPAAMGPASSGSTSPWRRPPAWRFCC